jgi:peptide/nickel transport system substrate-binding protein
MKRLTCVSLLLVLATSLLAACAPAATPAPAPNAAPAAPAATVAPTPVAKAATKPLRIGMDVDAGTGDPRLQKDTTAYRLRELVFNGLVGLQPDYSAVPDLAEKWENPTPTTWVFTLRKGVKFHNGTELKATDVKYTYESVLDQKFASPLRSFYTPIQKVEAVDDYTVRFTLDAPYAPFLSYAELAIVPQAVASDPNSDFSNKPVGTGPFKFVSWKKGDTIELDANPDYFAGRPKLDHITIKIVPDNSARVVAVESGGLDFVQSPLSPQDVTRMAANKNFKVTRIPAAGYTYVSLNTADPILADVKVRQALSYAVDRKQILESIYKGIGTVGTSPIPAGMWAYTPDVPSYDLNVAKAKQLLDDAGWKAGADGIRAKDGKPLKLTVRTHSEDPDRRQVIEVLQAEFQAIGVQADTGVTDFPTLNADMTAGKYQVAVIGWLNLSNPDRAMFRQFTKDGAGNYGKYLNADVDKLIRDARTTLDQAKAKDMYQQATKQIVQDAPYIFLQNQEYIAIYRADLNGFVPNPVHNFRSFKDITIGQ